MIAYPKLRVQAICFLGAGACSRLMQLMPCSSRTVRSNTTLHSFLAWMAGTASVGFESPAEHIEIRTTAGRLVFHLFAALAEFEQRLIIERTRAKLTAAKGTGPRKRMHF